MADAAPPLPPRTSLWSRLRAFLGEHMEVTLQSVQVAAIIVGGFAFLYQYYDNVAKDKKQETLKYAAKSYEDKILGGMAILAKPFEDPDFKRQYDVSLDESYEKKDICPIFDFYTNTVMPLYAGTDSDRREFFRSFNELGVFFTSLAVCVNGRVCDLNTACEFFFYPLKTYLTRHCIQFDRFELNFGYRSTRDIEAFLKSCNQSERFKNKVRTLSYCEDIKLAAGKQVKDLYGSCGQLNLP